MNHNVVNGQWGASSLWISVFVCLPSSHCFWEAPAILLFFHLLSLCASKKKVSAIIQHDYLIEPRYSNQRMACVLYITVLSIG